MARLESSIERSVARRCRVKSVKLKDLGAAGYPDRLFFVPGGRPLLIEFKRPGEVPGPLQEYTHRQLRRLGYQVEVYDDIATALRAIARAVAAAKK
jgi:hypothetical protein